MSVEQGPPDSRRDPGDEHGLEELVAITRGGYFDRGIRASRSGVRNKNAPDHRFNDLGVRVARVVDP